jgi:hypothetical protein
MIGGAGAIRQVIAVDEAVSVVVEVVVADFGLGDADTGVAQQAKDK